jgi:Na+/phosphate symporter
LKWGVWVWIFGGIFLFSRKEKEKRKEIGEQQLLYYGFLFFWHKMRKQKIRKEARMLAF